MLPKVLKQAPAAAAPAPGPTAKARAVPIGSSGDPIIDTGILGIGKFRALKLTPPTLQEDSTSDHTLEIDIDKNIQSFRTEMSLDLTRFSADGSQNNCWFDSFLFCTSKVYRAHSLSGRQGLAKQFRIWCANTTDRIEAGFPAELKAIPGFDDFNTPQKLKAELVGSKEIDALAGFIIAWFFKTNLVFVNSNETGVFELNCFSNYQTPDCPVICMLFTGNHFEPLCKFTPDEKVLTTPLTWQDESFCKLKTLSLACDANSIVQNTLVDPTLQKWFGHWTAPTCEEGVGFGGRRRKTRRHRRRVRKTNRRHRS